MIGEADDLMLNLMQVADDVEPPPEKPVAGSNPLSSLKPYPHHKDCGGAVQTAIGVDEEEEDPSKRFVFRFFCVKCNKEEIVPAKVIAQHGDNVAMDVMPPEWVSGPTV